MNIQYKLFINITFFNQSVIIFYQYLVISIHQLLSS